jgi:hypothetical protein
MNMTYASGLISKPFYYPQIFKRRKAIMNTVKIFYMALAKENIPIYGVVSYQDLKFFIGRYLAMGR